MVLPDRQQLLRAVDKSRACGEGHVTMGRRHDRDERGVTDSEIAHAMSDCQCNEIEVGHDRLGDLQQYFLRRGMAFVGQALDTLAVIVIAHVAREGDDRTCAVIAHRRLHRLEVQWSVDHLDKTNCAHAAIIGVPGRFGLGKVYFTAVHEEHPCVMCLPS